MSLIIEDEIFSIGQMENPKYKLILNTSGTILNKFPYQNEIKNRTFQSMSISEIKNINNKCLQFVIAFKQKLFNALDIWYMATLDENAIYSSEKLIVAKGQMPYKIFPYKKKLMALKQISRNKIGEPKYCKISITEEGLIQISLPKQTFTANVANSFKLGVGAIAKNIVFNSYLENIVNFMLRDAKQSLRNIFSTLTDLQIKQQTIARQIQKQNEQTNLKFQLYRYLVRSPIQLRFDCTEGSALYEQVVDISISEQRQIQETINYMRYANELKLSSLRLFLKTDFIFEGKQRDAFYITAKEKQITKNLLEIPQIVATKQNIGSGNLTIQNKYMFNNIIFQLPKQTEPLILLGQSGFGRIQFGTFNFWYLVNSKLEKHQMEQTLKQSNKIKKKYLIVKSPRSANDLQGCRKYHAKQSHEIKIINRLKGLSCALIPRFYQVDRFYPQPFTDTHNKYIEKYQRALLSQLTSCYGEPGYNIGHLIEERWNTLTFKKVIYIMSQLAQAIRFLNLNKIVHLDLKPQNILFLKNYSIKLIDFGQSFHPLVPYQNCPPAYTYPYGCPQIASQVQAFSDKCDVFSFGVILYELLYGKDILTTSPQLLLKQFRSKQYANRIFFNPEELQNYGQNFILPMLNHLIIKSLSPNIDSRPSMTWISVLLKNYLQLLS